MDSYIDAVYVSSVNLGNECIQVYDAETGTNVKSYRGNCVSLNTLCTVGKNDYLMCAQKDKPLLEAWAINQHEAVPLRFPVPGRISCMTVNFSGPKYCAVGIEEKIYVYELQSGHLLCIIKRHYQYISCLQFTPCGNYLASAGEDGFVYLWSKRSIIENLHKADRPQVEPHFIIGQHLEKVTGLSISPQGMRGTLLTSSLDNSCKLFDLTTGQLRHNIIFKEHILSICFNSIGSQIFVASAKGRVWGINLLPAPQTRDLEVNWPSTQCHDKSIKHICTTTDGCSLLTGSDDGEVKLFTIVMNMKALKGESSITFAFQKTLHIGRGFITNLFCQRIDREIYNASDLSSMIVLAPFSSQKQSNILDAKVQVPIKPIVESVNPLTFVEMAACVLGDYHSFRDNSSDTKGSKMKTGLSSENDSSILAENQKVKKVNEDLYKLCMKHIMFEE